MVMPKIRVTREDLSKLQLYKDHMKLVQADVDGSSGDQRHAISLVSKLAQATPIWTG